MTSTDAPESTRREWWRVDKNALLSRTVDIEIAVRKLMAEQYEVYAEIHRRGLRGVSGHDSLAGLIGEDLRLTPAEAKARAERVLALHPTPTFTGIDVPAVAPLAAQAAAEGALGAAQLDPIIHALAQIPATVPEEEVRVGRRSWSTSPAWPDRKRSPGLVVTCSPTSTPMAKNPRSRNRCGQN